jgi:hypothetical protein
MVDRSYSRRLLLKGFLIFLHLLLLGDDICIRLGEPILKKRKGGISSALVSWLRQDMKKGKIYHTSEEAPSLYQIPRRIMILAPSMAKSVQRPGR